MLLIIWAKSSLSIDGFLGSWQNTYKTSMKRMIFLLSFYNFPVYNIVLRFLASVTPFLVPKNDHVPQWLEYQINQGTFIRRFERTKCSILLELDWFYTLIPTKSVRWNAWRYYVFLFCSYNLQCCQKVHFVSIFNI